MRFDFDQPIDRRGTHSMKWDMMEAAYGVSAEDGIPMWVADMDFKAPPAVNEALIRAAEHGVHGYFGDDRAYKSAMAEWLRRRHGWRPEAEWISIVHGLVTGTALCLRAFTEPGDGVVLFTPVYHAFHRIIRANGRRAVQSPMRLRDGRYEMDLEALEQTLDGSERMVILCSPHNPGGRVWSADELRAVADLCARRDMVLVSDEIHQDLVYPGARHIPTAAAAPEAAPRLATLVAATKTFNIAGALTGSVIISDPALRARFRAAHEAMGATPNRMGVLMATAAYEGGEPWLEALLPYLDENRRILESGLAALPGVRVMPLQSTYLAWADFADMPLPQDEIRRRLREKARIAVNYGETFGVGGETFLRFNFATRRALVKEAAARLAEAFADLG